MTSHLFHLLGPEAGDEAFARVQHIQASEVSQSTVAWSITRRTLNAGMSRGVDLVEVDNGCAKFMIVPTRGMGLWKAFVGEEPLGWESPVRGPVHPAFVRITEPSGFGWLSGFDELMCRCGLISNGAPEFDDEGRLVYPIHGRIANLPAYEVSALVDEAAQTITVRGLIEETRFHFEKLRLTVEYQIPFAGTTITWTDRVLNYGGTPVDIQMLYHTNLGRPLLDVGSQLLAPVNQVTRWEGNPPDVDGSTWPHYEGPQAGKPQECYYLDLRGDQAGNTQVLLHNAQGDAGASLKFNTNQLPCFTQWKNEVAVADGYVTGLEPALNFPHTRTREVEEGRCQHLGPGEEWQATVQLDWHRDSRAVQEAVNAIQSLQGDHQPELV